MTVPMYFFLVRRVSPYLNWRILAGHYFDLFTARPGDEGQNRFNTFLLFQKWIHHQQDPG